MAEIPPISANRPWYQLHLTTLIALLVVGAALADCQVDGRHWLSWGINLLENHETVAHGWPMISLFAGYHMG